MFRSSCSSRGSVDAEKGEGFFVLNSSGADSDSNGDARGGEAGEEGVASEGRPEEWSEADADQWNLHLADESPLSLVRFSVDPLSFKGLQVLPVRSSSSCLALSRAAFSCTLDQLVHGCSR